MHSRADAEFITKDRLEALKRSAAESARRRVNFNFHETLEENPNRFLNVMARGTYVAPHRHSSVPKPESFVVLEGDVGFLVFGDRGDVEIARRLGPGSRPRTLGVDLRPGIWHTLVVLSEVAVIFEVKPGPYVLADDKDFAPWAPREGSPDAEAYLRSLEALFR